MGSGAPKPKSIQGLSASDRAAAQNVDSEAAWEAQQKAAMNAVSVDFNPYDPETGYWLGEWICADCGFIYGSRGETQAFETLGRWYKCPQCAGPRLGRRRHSGFHGDWGRGYPWRLCV